MTDTSDTPNMGTTAKAIWIKWYPKEAIDGMVQLEPAEELAYRRLLDLIYVTGNRVVDDDRRLGRMTKTGRKWKKIKSALLTFDKIYIKDGIIRNQKCDEILAQYERDMAQRSAAGKASAVKRKALNPTETISAVDWDVVTSTPETGQATNLGRKKESQSQKLESSPSGEGTPVFDATIVANSLAEPIATINSENFTKRPKSKRKRTALPEGWSVPASWLAAARDHAKEKGVMNIDWADEAAGFYAYHSARGSLMALWKSAWTTWVRNAVKWNREGGSTGTGGKSQVKSAAVANAFGRLRNDLSSAN